MTDQEISAVPTLEPEADTAPDQAAVLTEAITVVDTALAQMMQRELVSSGEVADLLLDVRMLLTTAQAEETA